MKLQVPFLQLPLRFDAAALAAEIQALGESVWRPHPQGFPGNSALPLVAADGDPSNDAVRGRMRPTPHLEKLPYLREVLGSFGAVLGRSRLMRLSGQAEVSAHVDVDYYWRDHMRVHVPVITQPEVQFHCGDRRIHMAAGECWIFDTWRMHRVVNSATRSRIHIVADTVGGEGFWDHISRARVPEMPLGSWTANLISPGSSQPALRYESVNLPTVMTPWELREQLTFILDEAVPDPRLAELHHLAGQLGRQWRSLWACYGEDKAGWPEYRAAIRTFMREVERVGQTLMLSNQLTMLRAVTSLVGAVAVSDEHATVLADERSAPMSTAM